MSHSYPDEGHLKPTLVILHGLFGSMDNFRSIARHLESRMQVLRLDLPGHGQAPSIPELSIPAMATRIISTLADRDIQSFCLLGHSLGGKVAMQIAADLQSRGRCPDHAGKLRVDRLCIVDIAPKLYPPHHADILDALKRIDLQQIDSRNDAETQLCETIADVSTRAFILKSLYRDSAGQFHWRFDLDLIIRDYDLIRQSPQISESVSCPTLFIKGADSDYLQPQDAQLVEALFEQPSLKSIHGTGHWPHAEKPDLFTRICADFFAGKPAVNPSNPS